MSPTTRTLHQSLIRAAKMALSAWEKWLSDDGREVLPTPPVHPGSPRGTKQD